MGIPGQVPSSTRRKDRLSTTQTSLCAGQEQVPKSQVQTSCSFYEHEGRLPNRVRVSDGDRILCQAQSTELDRYGLSAGLKNYAAAYCTGLLCARRLLQKLGLDELYEGNTEVDGEVVSTEYDNKMYYVEEVDDDKRPFRALLDVGCNPTTTGHRVFGALKGAADGGLDVPHSEKR